MKFNWTTSTLRELVGYISKGIAPAYADEENESTIIQNLWDVAKQF